MTRKEIVTAIEQNRGKDLFLVAEEPSGREKEILVCMERVSKTTLLHKAKYIQKVRCSTYRAEGLDDIEGCQWYDEMLIFHSKEV